MARLRARARRRLPRKDFGLPGRKAYPMPDRGHAIAAKGRAKTELKRGRLSRSAYDRIVAKANRKLKSTHRR